MNFSVAALIVASVFSAIGSGYFLYGRRAMRPFYLVCGAALVVFPWFVTSLAALAGIGILLLAAPVGAGWWFGY